MLKEHTFGPFPSLPLPVLRGFSQTPGTRRQKGTHHSSRGLWGSSLPPCGEGNHYRDVITKNSRHSRISKREMTAQTAPLSLWLILCCPLSQKCRHLEAADEADALLEQLADYSPSSPKKMDTQLGTHRAHAFVFRSWLMETRTACSKETPWPVPQEGWAWPSSSILRHEKSVALKHGRVHKRAHRPDFCLERRRLLLRSRVLPSRRLRPR